MLRNITICLLITLMASSFGMMKKNIESTDKARNIGIRWNFELYNKANYPAEVWIGNKISQGSLVMEYLETVPPMKKVRTVINQSIPLAVEIKKNNQKATEVFVKSCLPNQPCAKTVFLTLDSNGLRPQTGQWYGLKGVTDSELDITQNIKDENMKNDWRDFVAQNRTLFQNKIYMSQQPAPSIDQQAEESLRAAYTAAKEKLSELWYGKSPNQEEIAIEIKKSKKFIVDESDLWIAMANKNNEPTFRKASAIAILNKWKRESTLTLDKANTIEEIKAIKDNFQNKTADTRYQIKLADEKTTSKNLISKKADSMIADANNINSKTFKKSTALATVNKWKRETIKAIDQAQTLKDIQNSLDTFNIQTENTKNAILEEKQKQ